MMLHQAACLADYKTKVGAGANSITTSDYATTNTWAVWKDETNLTPTETTAVLNTCTQFNLIQLKTLEKSKRCFDLHKAKGVNATPANWGSTGAEGTKVTESLASCATQTASPMKEEIVMFMNLELVLGLTGNDQKCTK